MNRKHHFAVTLIFLSLALGLAASRSAGAAPQATIVTGPILADTTWDLAHSPYQVDGYIIVPAGITLTIDAGVTVENYSGTGSHNYNFDVAGRLIANGTNILPIHFYPGSNGWSGINITGTPGAINTGSSLNYVIVEGGGYGGSGVAANLRLQYATVDVHHCQFNNSPGDGILGDDAGGQGVANIYDSLFIGNAGYAVNFQDGSVNPALANLTATGNGAALPYGGNLVNINDATLHGAHTWENMGLPYLILGTIVGPDGVLTIEPGVHVLAQPGNDALDVAGRLAASGTVSQPIHFESADAASGWSGISIRGDESQPSAGNLLNYVTITRGGFTGGRCDLYLTYGDATVTHSRLESGQQSGVCLDHGATLVMSDTQLTNNQAYAMDVLDAGAQFALDNISASGNTSDTIGIGGGTLTGMHTWPKAGINTYDLYYSYVTIAPTGTLNIEPGVTVLFGETRDMTVRGNLTALGTRTSPITFTGESPTPGLWSGLSFVGTADHHAAGQLAYATLEYGGYGGSALVSIDNADVTFDHCTLRYSASDAIEVLPGAQTLRKADTSAAPMVQASWSRFAGIGGYAIDNRALDVTVLAAFNWWGDASGPTAADNPDGAGAALNGPVLYRPFLIGPDGAFVFLPMVTR